MDLNLVFQPNHFQGVLQEQTPCAADMAIESADLQLWKNFQAGSEIAYETIYRDHAAMLYSFGLKLTKDKELVKDCIQDLFIELWKSKHRLAPVKSIKSYLFRSMRRRVIAESVKKRKNLFDSIRNKIPGYLQNCSAEVNLIENQDFAQQRQELKMALSMLTDRQKEIIHLKFYSLLSYVEISEVMALSIKGTYKLMGRSICRLRKYMNARSYAI